MQLQQIPTHQVDSRPRSLADLRVSPTISHTFEVSRIKKRITKVNFLQMPVLSLEEVSGE